MLPLGWDNLSIREIGNRIGDRQLDPRELVAYFAEKIEREPEKNTIFTSLFLEEARIEAEAAYQRAIGRRRRSHYDGIPLVWKDNIDISGKATTAGLRVFQSRIATKNAPAYQIALDAGFICLGKTNMTELAFSGLGINTNFGTPSNPFDRNSARVPGGSSSGSAVAVAKGLCCAAIGTDTGGSVRTPAAWNNLVGLKTTATLISTEGVVPLSQTLDTIGFLTRFVDDAAALFEVFSQGEAIDLSANITEFNLLVCNNFVWNEIQADVLEVIDRFLEIIPQRNVRTNRDSISSIEDISNLVNTQGNIISYQASQNWLGFLEENPDSISASILDRFRSGSNITADTIESVNRELEYLRQLYLNKTRDYDAVIMPTVVTVPPIIRELEADSNKYALENLLSLRNTRIANFLGCCALSLPIGMTASGFPVGLMLVAPPFREAKLLQVAAALESIATESQAN